MAKKQPRTKDISNETNDIGKISVISHIIIRDKETGEELVNKRA